MQVNRKMIISAIHKRPKRMEQAYFLLGKASVLTLSLGKYDQGER
jgi:hypothetical protein